MIIDEVLSCSPSWWKRTAGSVPDCEQARMYDTQIFESSSDPIWTMRAHCSVTVVRFQGGGVRLDTEEERVSELRLVRRRDGWQARQPPGIGSGQSHTCPESVGALTVSVIATYRKSKRRGFRSTARGGSSFNTTHAYKKIFDPRYARYFYVPNQHQTASPVSALQGWRHSSLKDAQSADAAEYGVLYGLFD